MKIKALLVVLLALGTGFPSSLDSRLADEGK